MAPLDIPWMPLNIAFAFILAPVLRWIAMGGALFLIAVTLLMESSCGRPRGGRGDGEAPDDRGGL